MPVFRGLHLHAYRFARLDVPEHARHALHAEFPFFLGKKQSRFYSPAAVVFDSKAQTVTVNGGKPIRPAMPSFVLRDGAAIISSGRQAA